MKKLAMILTLFLVVTSNGFSPAQAQWPDPCNQDIILQELNCNSTSKRWRSQVGIPIAYMGYFARVDYGTIGPLGLIQIIVMTWNKTSQFLHI